MSDAQAPVTQNGVEETPSFKVFAGNLAYSTTDEGLKAFFAAFQSDIVSTQIILRGTRSAGYGFVAFSSVEAAEKAAGLLNKKDLDGREVIVELAKPADQKAKDKTQRKDTKRAGRRGSKAPPGEVTEAEANGEVDKPEAAKADGEPKTGLKKKKAPRKKRTDAEGADAAAPATTQSADGGDDKKTGEKKPRPPRKVREPRPPRPAGEAPVGEPSKNMIFVANLGFNVDDAALSELFTSNGLKVVSARVVRRRWGQPRKSKGYGFVDVGGEDEQKKAIEILQGKDVGGREIAVKIAVNATKDDDEKDVTPDATVIAS